MPIRRDLWHPAQCTQLSLLPSLHPSSSFFLSSTSLIPISYHLILLFFVVFISNIATYIVTACPFGSSLALSYRSSSYHRFSGLIWPLDLWSSVPSKSLNKTICLFNIISDRPGFSSERPVALAPSPTLRVHWRCTRRRPIPSNPTPRRTRFAW